MGMFSNIIAPSKQAIGSFLGIDVDEHITDEMSDWMLSKIKKEVGKGNFSGGLDYDDYGMGDGNGNLATMFSKKGLLSPEMAWGNTLGRANWKVDKKSGEVSFTGDEYDFRPGQYGWVGDIISGGGLFSDEIQKFTPKININSTKKG